MGVQLYTFMPYCFVMVITYNKSIYTYFASKYKALVYFGTKRVGVQKFTKTSIFYKYIIPLYIVIVTRVQNELRRKRNSLSRLQWMIEFDASTRNFELLFLKFTRSFWTTLFAHFVFYIIRYTHGIYIRQFCFYRIRY